MEHWQNLSLENLSEVYEDILYIEEWKPISGYEEKYHVSSFGRIKSLFYKRKKKAAILKQGITTTGYLRVDLVTKDNHQQVHVLVAKEFISNPENKPEVNHKLGITTDNRFWQLEWATKREQQIHAQKVLGFKPNIDGLLRQVEKTKRKVNQLHPVSKEIIQTYSSIKEASDKFGLGKDAIYRVIKLGQPLAGGYKWEYV